MVIRNGDIFNSEATTLVNPVNCSGVINKGPALEFCGRYPDMADEYFDLCGKKKIKPGKPHFYVDESGISILNFPTQKHWQSPSKLSYIARGLEWLRENYEKSGIETIAFPALGCGQGGLQFKNVYSLMEAMVSDLPICVEVYTPLSDTARSGFGGGKDD